MPSLLDRKLLFITGKGGVGKTTMSAAIALLAAREGRHTIVVEVGEQTRLPTLFGVKAPSGGATAELSGGLSSISIDPDRALLEWLQALGGRVSGRVLASSNTFQYFAAAAPGAKELISMVKIWELTRGNRWRGRERGRRRGYDLVVLDAPATGHALGMLGSPSTFGRIARVGPIASQTERLRALLEDPARSSYFAVAQATEMAISETLELQERLRERLGRELDAVVVNGVLPQRFSNGELRALAPLRDGPGGRGTAASTVRRSALLAARAVSERARFQRNQLARLRRRSFAVIAVPFQFTAELDLESVRRIAAHLGRTI
jgi:anion-transporting  ArsA/GET3 family ATPase